MIIEFIYILWLSRSDNRLGNPVGTKNTVSFFEKNEATLQLWPLWQHPRSVCVSEVPLYMGEALNFMNK
jgi:hypothetical protein